jgi:hypothetical protein
VLELVEEAFDEVALAIDAKSQLRGALRFAFGGITGVMPRRARLSMNGSASKALSPSNARGSTVSSSGSAQVR